MRLGLNLNVGVLYVGHLSVGDFLFPHSGAEEEPQEQSLSGRAGGIDHAGDTGMIEIRKKLAFPEETVAPGGSTGSGVEDFDGNHLLNLAVAALGQIDCAHTARAEQTNQYPKWLAGNWTLYFTHKTLYTFHRLALSPRVIFLPVVALRPIDSCEKLSCLRDCNTPHCQHSMTIFWKMAIGTW